LEKGLGINFHGRDGGRDRRRISRKDILIKWNGKKVQEALMDSSETAECDGVGKGGMF
jgi:hypothetical protein